jgi:hypothetical protein
MVFINLNIHFGYGPRFGSKTFELRIRIHNTGTIRTTVTYLLVLINISYLRYVFRCSAADANTDIFLPRIPFNADQQIIKYCLIADSHFYQCFGAGAASFDRS